jgi:hypothetical protein
LHVYCSMANVSTTYFINRNLVAGYVGRQQDRVGKTMFIAGLMVLGITAVHWYLETADIGKVVVALSAIVPVGILAVMYYHNKTLLTYAAENLRIVTDADSITRVVNLTNHAGLNFIHRYLYKSHSHRSSYFCTMLFSQIREVEHRDNDIVLLTATSNKLTGYDILIIPRELENLDALLAQINERRK